MVRTLSKNGARGGSIDSAPPFDLLFAEIQLHRLITDAVRLATAGAYKYLS